MDIRKLEDFSKEQILSLQCDRRIECVCVNCKKIFISLKYTIKNRFVNNEDILCKTCSSKAGFIKKYGVDNPAKSNQVIVKMKKTISLKSKKEKLLIVEKFKTTCLEKYGVDNPAKNSEIKNKTRETCFEKYNGSNPFSSEEVKNKSKQTCIEKYGVDNAAKSNIIKNKSKETNIKKYGCNSPLQNKSVQEKIKQTLLNKYGVDNMFKHPDVQKISHELCRTPEAIEKSRKKFFEKYGVSWYTKSEEYKNLMKEIVKNRTPEQKENTKKLHEKAFLKRYGVRWNSQSKEHRSKCMKKIEYNNQKFDSSWELIFYRYHKEILKNNILHENKSFSYVYNEKIFIYFPDFEIDGIIYEIKGDHLIDSENNLMPLFGQNPEKLKAKSKLMKDLNVEIIKWENIKEMKDMLKNFDNNNL